MEACGFRDAKPQFGDVKIIGVSPDTVAKQRKFARKFDLDFPLLSDRNHELAQACGVWVEKSSYGLTYMGLQRTTFLIGEDGAVERVWSPVKVQGHAQEVLAAR